MKVIQTLQPRPSILLFAEKYDLTLEIIERESASLQSAARYCVRFKGCDLIKDKDCVNYEATGLGSTDIGAVSEYTRKISGKTLVFGAHTPCRVEIDCPVLEVVFIIL